MRGRSTEEDKRGNDEADALAVAGASFHKVSPEVPAAAKLRKSWARQVQRMMLMVLHARFAAEGENQTDAMNGDRGSDCDCMEFVDVELDDGGSSDCESCSGVCIVAVAAAACLPGNEPLPAPLTEPAQHELLNDECDEGIGTFYGVVQ